MRRDILLDLTTVARPQFQCINAGTPLERARQNARSEIIIISKLIHVIGKKCHPKDRHHQSDVHSNRIPDLIKISHYKGFYDMQCLGMMECRMLPKQIPSFVHRQLFKCQSEIVESAHGAPGAIINNVSFK